MGETGRHDWSKNMRYKGIITVVVLVGILAVAWTIVQPGVDGGSLGVIPTPTSEPLLLHTADTAFEIERSPDVPALPFEDNVDPSLCGIPRQWTADEPAYLTGVYEGELIQPAVFLYDSHLRREVVGQVPHGTQIQILLSQSNPTLDYFFVKIPDTETPIEGWVPAPFIVFEPPNDPA
jgi:hypothetical protein